MKSPLLRQVPGQRTWRQSPPKNNSGPCFVSPSEHDTTGHHALSDSSASHVVLQMYPILRGGHMYPLLPLGWEHTQQRARGEGWSPAPPRRSQLRLGGREAKGSLMSPRDAVEEQREPALLGRGGGRGFLL
ncbi:hypothetical protein KIL84_006037 [Mauremys mutica]|uniref:Uncharacterized protein n=1 Tax=Mauremys mutica TaxID=74926 RepID=A0A9D3XHW1_9SAUR|nr:hypothetical protein KIL84_006037 [Mauremys mutica]